MKIPKLQTAFQPLMRLTDTQPIDIFADKAEYDRQKWQRDHTMAHYIDEDYFTGPQTRLKEIVVTANKPKKSYSGYTEPLPRSVQPVNISDITKGVHAVVNPALAWFSPSQYVGAFRDTDNAADWFRSMMRGNSGFVTKEFEEKHPWLSLATNVVGDAATLGGIAKGFKYAWEAIPRVSLERNAEAALPVVQPSLQYQYRPVEVGGRRPYISPATERVSITTADPIMATTSIIHPARGRFNPILESDIPELQNMLNTGQYREMTIPGSARKVRMYFPNGNKQPIREDELQLLLSKYQPKRELSLQEKELAKQAPGIIKKLKQKGIDFTEDTWFQGRGSLGSNRPDAITQLDLDIYYSHMPEMEQLAKSLQLSGDLVEKSPGKWFGKIDGKMKKVDPADYIASRSKAFQDNGWYWDGINYRRAMTNEQFNDILNNGDFGKTTWTTDGKDQANIFLSEPPRSKLVQNLVGNIHRRDWKPRPAKYAKEARELLNGVEYSPNVNYRGTTGNYLLFGQDVPVKSLRGNNLDYSKQYKGIYKMLIPATLGGTYINNTNN